jgi:hypothetical protein
MPAGRSSRTRQAVFEATPMIVRPLPLIAACLLAGPASVAQAPPATAAVAPRDAHRADDARLHACMAEADQQHRGGQARKNRVAGCVRRP